MSRPSFSVGFASTDWSKIGEGIAPNGCTWYRCMLPARQLAQAKIDTEVGVLNVRPNGRFAIQHPFQQKSTLYKIIVLKVVMHKAALDNIEKAKAAGQKIVVDIDDLFPELHEKNLAYKNTDPQKNKDNNREILASLIERATALICSTPFIYDYYKTMYPDKPIFMVRNSIDTDRWPRVFPAKREPRIGWLGATPWRSKDLEQLSPFFNEYITSRKVVFHHTGHINWATAAFIPLGITDKTLLTASPMVPLSELPQAYSEMDIGIVPLNDIPFNRAKSFIKGLEYAAAGVPFVASSLPEYEHLAQNGVGRVASTHNEWISHLDELLDYKIRKDEAILNREIIEEEFSIKSQAAKWINVFSEISKL